MILRYYCIPINYANNYPARAMNNSPLFHLLGHTVDGEKLTEMLENVLPLRLPVLVVEDLLSSMRGV